MSGAGEIKSQWWAIGGSLMAGLFVRIWTARTYRSVLPRSRAIWASPATTSRSSRVGH